MPQPLQQNVTNADGPLSGEFLSYVLEHFVKLTAIQRMQLGSSLLQLIIQKDFSEDMSHFVSSDFLSLLLLSMEISVVWKRKRNTIYYLCKAVGERRLDTDRMPFGLISYNDIVNLFVASLFCLHITDSQGSDISNCLLLDPKIQYWSSGILVWQIISSKVLL